MKGDLAVLKCYAKYHAMEIRVYLGARTCELFLCFVVIVRVRVIMLTSLFSLFYVTREFHRFLHRGRAGNSLTVFQYVGLNSWENDWNNKRIHPGWMMVKFKNVLWLKHCNNTIFLVGFSGYYWPCSRTQGRKTTNYNNYYYYYFKACLLNQLYYFCRISQVKTLRN